MSRTPTAADPSTPVDPRGPGRHRLGRASGIRVADLPAVHARLQQSSPSGSTRSRLSAFAQWLAPTAPAGRHTWGFLSGAGGRPRTAFAIILSL